MNPRRSAPALVVLLLAAALPGLHEARAATAATVSPETVEALISQAEAARVRAAELGAEWLETRELIAEARKWLEHGDLQQASERAEQARQQGELAAAQSEREATAWQRRIVR